jgi:hypothetical protein
MGGGDLSAVSGPEYAQFSPFLAGLPQPTKHMAVSESIDKFLPMVANQSASAPV